MLLCMVLGGLGLLVVGVVVGVVGHATLGLAELKKGPSGLSVAIHEWFEARNTTREVGSGVVNTKVQSGQSLIDDGTGFRTCRFLVATARDCEGDGRAHGCNN
jgi:hypothetical protein